MSRFSLLLAGTVMIALTAGCAGPEGLPRAALKSNAAFWQRANVSESVFMDGPKAQQMLHRDIARCVTELRELEELGSLRNALPAENSHYHDAGNREEQALAEWETPDHDGYLLAEHGNYHDFESCMVDKGWERVEHVPYDVAEKSRENYLQTIIGERYRTRIGTSDYPHQNDESDFGGLNQ